MFTIQTSRFFYLLSFIHIPSCEPSPRWLYLLSFTFYLLPFIFYLLSFTYLPESDHSTFRDTYITIAKMVNKPILPTNKA